MSMFSANRVVILPASVNMGPFESEFSEFGVSVSLKIPNYFIL